MKQTPTNLIEACEQARLLAQDGRGVEAADLLAAAGEGGTPRERVALLLARAWIAISHGRTDQLSGFFEEADALAVRALRLCENEGLPVWEAQHVRATTFRRRGRHNAARSILRVALAELPADQLAWRVRLGNHLCVVEYESGNFAESARLCEAFAGDVALLDEPYLAGQFHHNHANTLKKLGRADVAAVEFTAAQVSFERAGNRKHLAAVDNDFGELLIAAGNTRDAHLYLDRAQSYFEGDAERPADRSALGLLCETRACAFEAEGKLRKGLEAADESVRYLEGGDEVKLLEASHETRGRILAKLGLNVARGLVEEKARSVVPGDDDALAIGAGSDGSGEAVAGSHDAFAAAGHEPAAVPAHQAEK